MRVSRTWLQRYFESPLPPVAELAEALTFHAFEIESIEGDVLDVKVLPDRAGYALSHRGIAKEISAILSLPLKRDPLREELPEYPSGSVSINIDDASLCHRYIGATISGVKITPSPAWLAEALNSVGQRSINNVVDATNFVMLDIGQPLHAYDADALEKKDNVPCISVRTAREAESITTLDHVSRDIPEGTLLIADGITGTPLGIAGIKGGTAAEVTDATTNIVLEAANFDGSTVRRAAQKLKIFTDASLRFQNRPSSELVAYGMRDVCTLITEIAGGTITGVTDVYPQQPVSTSITLPYTFVNGVLGSDFSKEKIENVFQRLSLKVESNGDMFTVTPPFERTDLTIPEDLVDEVGRIVGYDQIPGKELPATSHVPDQSRFRGIEKVKDFLVERGFTEISTQSFAKKGDILLANPLDKSKPALRTTLKENMDEALTQAKQYAPRVLGPGEKPKLFEIGTIFTKHGEDVVLQTSEPVTDIPPLEKDQEYTPKKVFLDSFVPYSSYPFMLRDIAAFAPQGASEKDFEDLIRANAPKLLVRADLFDRFEKEGRTSYAFRLVFESMDKTLTDEEINMVMEKIYGEAIRAGYTIR